MANECLCRALNLGATLACIAVTLVVFVFGLGGFLANWAGLITEETNPNLYFFQLFANGEPYMHTVTGRCLPTLRMPMRILSERGCVY